MQEELGVAIRALGEGWRVAACLAPLLAMKVSSKRGSHGRQDAVLHVPPSPRDPEVACASPPSDLAFLPPLISNPEVAFASPLSLFLHPS